MDGPDVPAIRASNEEREETRLLLEEACVDGRLTLEEFSERVGQAMTARTQDELRVLTLDLPTRPAVRAGPDAPSSSITAIMTSVERSGTWQVPQHSRVVVFLGECKLDLRGARISARATTFDVRVLMGNLEIVVPEGVETIVDATIVAASRTVRLDGQPPPPDAPVIRITGSAVASSITVRDQPTLRERLGEKMREMLE